MLQILNPFFCEKLGYFPLILMSISKRIFPYSYNKSQLYIKLALVCDECGAAGNRTLVQRR